MLNKLINSAHIISSINTYDISALKEALVQILANLDSLDISCINKYYDNQIVCSNRKYGNGAVALSPLGYFYPSELLPSIADNVSRGRIVKKANSSTKYVYDFDNNNRIIKISSIPNHTVTLCDKCDNICTYISFKVDNNDIPHEIVDITITKHISNSSLEAMLQISFFNDHQSIFNINIEKYNYISEHKKICNWHQLIPSQEGKYSFFDALETYMISYNDKLNSYDYDRIYKKQSYITV